MLILYLFIIGIATSLLDKRRKSPSEHLHQSHTALTFIPKNLTTLVLLLRGLCFRAGASQLMYCWRLPWKSRVTFTFVNRHFQMESRCLPPLTARLQGFFLIWFLISVMISTVWFYPESSSTIDTFEVQFIVLWYILPWSIYYATFDRSSCCHCNALEGYSHLLFLPTAL